MKVTLITGASSGIGKEFARQLAAKKHNLVLVARSEKVLHELCDELMLKNEIMAHYVALDLTEPRSELRLLNETERHGFEVDWLINNAGFGSFGDFIKLDIERELEMIELNVLALVALTHCFLKGMRSRKSGTIINVSSAAGFQPLPYMATYAATKAFVTSFSAAIAEENREFGIKVLALCPGSTKTNFFAASGVNKPLTLKGQHTAEEVVKSALSALKRGRSRIIPGVANNIGAALGTFTPSIITTRVMGKVLRSRLTEEK